jgi:hypothetical protein
MNKFVLSALALTSAGGLASAGTGSEEWLTLDREIESLASAQQASPQGQASGLTVGGFIRTSYQNSSDIDVGANDLGGFSLDNARINVEGHIGDYMLYVQLEGAEALTATPSPGDGLLNGPSEGGSVEVLDAYGAWNINEMFRLTMGQFRSPFLGSAQLDEDSLLFLDRTLLGYIWAARDLGVMLSGQYDMLGWWIAAQNGLDSVGDDLAFSARVAFDAMGGANARNKVEGAYGAAEGTLLEVSAGYYQDDDTIVDDVMAWNVEGNLVMGPFSAAASYVDHDDGFATLLAGNFTEGPSILALTAGFMFVPDRWEVAARYEDLDDEDSTSVITVGLNYYAVGHDAKWQVNYAMVDSDDDALEADILGIGLTVGV